MVKSVLTTIINRMGCGASLASTGSDTGGDIVITLKLRKIGNSVGAVFPKTALARMQVAEGDTLFLTEAPDGYRITPYDPMFEKQMTVARKVMKKRRNVLGQLAE